MCCWQQPEAELSFAGLSDMVRVRILNWGECLLQVNCGNVDGFTQGDYIYKSCLRALQLLSGSSTEAVQGDERTSNRCDRPQHDSSHSWWWWWQTWTRRIRLVATKRCCTWPATNAMYAQPCLMMATDECTRRRWLSFCCDPRLR